MLFPWQSSIAVGKGLIVSIIQEILCCYVHLRVEELSCDHELTLRITKQVQFVLYSILHTSHPILRTL